MNFTIKNYKGRAIRINPQNQSVCLTDMAIANGKQSNDWLRLKGTQEYLSAFSTVTGIPVTELLQVVQGGSPEEQGTWAHQKIAIRFAQWCSVEFAIQVDFWIDELLTIGKVELSPQEPKLPSRELALETAIAIDRIQDILSKSNPRLAQILIDHAMNDVIDSQPKLQSIEFPEDRWYGLVQIADKMGIKTDNSSRIKLGQYVSKLGLERVQEERLCNGQLQAIWCYRDNEETRQAILNWYHSI